MIVPVPRLRSRYTLAALGMTKSEGTVKRGQPMRYARDDKSVPCARRDKT